MECPSFAFHGTRSGGFEEFDLNAAGKASTLNDKNALLYGPGFYFTQDQDIAGEYANQGDIKRVMNESQFDEFTTKIGELIPDNFKLVQHPRQEGFGQYVEVVHKDDPTFKIDLAGEYNDMPGRWMVEEANADLLERATLMDAADYVRNFLPKREVKAVFLNIRNPFEAESVHKVTLSQLEAKFGRTVAGDVWHSSPRIGEEKVTQEDFMEFLLGNKPAPAEIRAVANQQIYHAMVRETASKEAANEGLQALAMTESRMPVE